MEAQIDIPDAFIEEWKDVPVKCPQAKYRVSSFGKVESTWRGRTRIMPVRYDKDGYPYVKFGVSNKMHKIHRLVAQAFIPNPEGKREVNHIDGDKMNNNVANLEWCTASENSSHRYHYLGKHGGLIRNKPVVCVETGQRYESAGLASKAIGVTRRSLSNAVEGRTKSSGGYHWRYADGD